MSGEINIDLKLLRKALDLKEIARALPLYYDPGTGTITYDGEWLKLTQASGYSAIGTGYGFPAYEAARDTYSLRVEATIKMDNDSNIYVFFLEPKKAEFSYFQGFRCPGGVHKFEFNNPGGGEEDLIAGQDWTTEHLFKIMHKKDRSICRGYIDGAMKAECTDIADISAQPFSIYVGEPNNTPRTTYLKYPPGITFIQA